MEAVFKDGSSQTKNEAMTSGRETRAGIPRYSKLKPVLTVPRSPLLDALRLDALTVMLVAQVSLVLVTEETSSFRYSGMVASFGGFCVWIDTTPLRYLPLSISLTNCSKLNTKNEGLETLSAKMGVETVTYRITLRHGAIWLGISTANVVYYEELSIRPSLLLGNVPMVST
jgi:hypothetical protein